MSLSLVKSVKNGCPIASFVALTRSTGVCLIPWRFSAPMNLNCVYFNLNFCTENWELKVSSLKFESRPLLCKEKLQSLLHLFWECSFFKNHFGIIGNWIRNSSCFLDQEYSVLCCLGIVNDTTNLLFHHALLIKRYHIYCSKTICMP